MNCPVHTPQPLPPFEPSELDMALETVPTRTSIRSSASQTQRSAGIDGEPIRKVTLKEANLDATHLSETSISRPNPHSSIALRNFTSSSKIPSKWCKMKRTTKKAFAFAGPGMVISVAYMDPGNYQTGLSAGSQYGYSLLFVVLAASLIACLLQALAIKLGSVTGKDLATICREECPTWLRIILWIFCELAVIATDFAEVIGFTVAMNLLFHIPLQAGVFITLIDVFVVLLIFKDTGTVRELRYFEILIAFFVIGSGVCFVVELTKVAPPAGDVMKGYLPSGRLFTDSGEFYAALGVLGATVMPHSLFIGTKLAPVRVREEDAQLKSIDSQNNLETTECSIKAISKSLPFAYLDSTASLLTLALFVNSAIVIVSAASFYNTPDANNIADLFSAYDILKEHLGTVAAVLFALALLFSGQSSSVVATLAGQIIAEGFMQWKIKPWIRRLLTRAITVIPSMIALSIGGRAGIANLLIASQAALSILLPFAMVPLIWFTGPWSKCMKVEREVAGVPSSNSEAERGSVMVKHDFSNCWFVTVLAWLSALGIVASNMYSIVTLIQGAV